ncbi:cytochrome P450 [Cyathus striatus]|nr:cytochrome P450 [Cyathus striatus]
MAPGASEINILIGLLTHQWLRKYQPSPHIVLTVLSAIPLVAGSTVGYDSQLSLAGSIWSSYYTVFLTTFVSTVLYRISPFHPLARYPGPYICKITKLWGAGIALLGRNHTYYKKLHDKYGPIIRIGPNELSIIEKEMIPFILGSNGMPKGPVWDGRRFGHAHFTDRHGQGYESVIDVRDMEDHAQVRKPWNRAFSIEAVKDYQGLLIPRTNQFREELRRICDSSSDRVGHVDMAQLVSFFAFDFMGDLAFGGCFELMRDGDQSGFWDNMESGLFIPSITQHVPWIVPFLHSLPAARKKIEAFISFGMEKAHRRVKMSVEKKDLFYHITEAASADTLESALPVVAANALLAIVAGADTSATIMSNVVYYLIANRVDYLRLQEEIDGASCTNVDGVPFEGDDLAKLPFLNAVINETLRLQPAVPTSLQRAPTKGSGGHKIVSIFLPEGNAVQVPPYTIHRDPRYFFPRPEQFWPERWLSEDGEVIVDRAAFIPFSAGQANCAGKTLAMMEMRYAIAILMRNFDMRFEDDYDPIQWERNLVDRFVFAKGKLPVRVTRRKLAEALILKSNLVVLHVNIIEDDYYGLQGVLLHTSVHSGTQSLSTSQ